MFAIELRALTPLLHNGKFVAAGKTFTATAEEALVYQRKCQAERPPASIQTVTPEVQTTAGDSSLAETSTDEVSVQGLPSDDSALDESPAEEQPKADAADKPAPAAASATPAAKTTAAAKTTNRSRN